MHEATLSRAALTSPTVVFGLLMRPYSLGHELFLLREGNPLATAISPQGIRAASLAQACMICCQTFNENRRTPFDWLRRPKIALWRWSVRKANIEQELKAFIAYRLEGSLEFPISDVAKPDRASGRMPGSPFLIRLQQWIMFNLRLSESEAWDYPYGLAKMRWATHWEQEGALDLYNAHDAEFDRFVEQQEQLATN